MKVKMTLLIICITLTLMISDFIGSVYAETDIRLCQKSMMGCPWSGGGWHRTPQRGWKQRQARISRVEAQVLLENFLKATNPRLTVGKITETDNTFTAQILTRDGTPTDTIVIDRRTGWFHSVR